MTALIPGQSPPPVSIPIRFVFAAISLSFIPFRHYTIALLPPAIIHS